VKFARAERPFINHFEDTFFMSTRFIAEVSSNHGQDLGRTLAFVDAAADIGCSGIKFQLFRIDALFAPEILARSAMHRSRAAWELPLDFLPKIAARCTSRGLAFGCTPFYLEAVTTLMPYVDFYKIASYELLWRDLFLACAATGKPIAFSTGIATLQEVDDAVSWLRAAGAETFDIFHCVSSYPARPAACNLAAIDTLRSRYRHPLGWSDHSANPAVIHRAVGRYRAETVEFHLDLDGRGAEFAAGHCWLPETIAPVIRQIRDGRIETGDPTADGDGLKTFSGDEADERLWRRDPSDGLRPFKELR
jgi:sialic acid synthase SpsE